MPCLLTVVKQINEPRHAGLKGVMKARKAEIPSLTAEDIGADPARCGLAGSPTNVVRIFNPTRSRKAERIEGEVPDATRTLVQKLRAEQVI